MRHALLAIAVLVIITGCAGARIASLAIVHDFGIWAGLITAAGLFCVGYLAGPYLD